MGLGKFVREWRELIRFKAMSAESRSIVFYSEDEASWKHFQPIIAALVEDLGKRVCYVTSSVNDPILQSHNSLIDVFYIGFGSARTVFFLTLSASVLAMTMPDLGNFNIKRSKSPVHYLYLFHSLVSTHMIYRHKAFDNFDSVLCVGPHHLEEIRATEYLYGLTPKQLVQAGYGLLDSIVEENTVDSKPKDTSQSGVRRVLVAPSWGPDAILEICGRELLEVLLEAGHDVTVRPHVMTMRHNPGLLTDLGRSFTNRSNFTMDLDFASQGTVANYDLMISDWSGAALEFAFGLERPVLYIDVPQKVNNPEYERIGFVPIEVKLRSDIGAVVSPDQLGDVPRQVEELCADSTAWKERIREQRGRWVYNLGSSGGIGANYIANLVASDVSSPSEH